MESMCICVRKITRSSVSTEVRQSDSCNCLFGIVDSLFILSHLFFKLQCQQHSSGLFFVEKKGREGGKREKNRQYHNWKRLERQEVKTF